MRQSGDNSNKATAKLFWTVYTSEVGGDKKGITPYINLFFRLFFLFMTH